MADGGLTGSLSRYAKSEARRHFLSAGLFGVTGMAIVGLAIVALIALHRYVALRRDPFTADGVVACILLVVALAAWIGARSLRRRKTPPPAVAGLAAASALPLLRLATSRTGRPLLAAGTVAALAFFAFRAFSGGPPPEGD